MANRNELYHYGVIGMKWGIRRYQNYDGSLTPAGKQRIKESGFYMNPRKNGENDYSKKVKNRRSVIKKFHEQYINKNFSDDEFYSFIDSYATATLKDLKIRPSNDAIKFVKQQYEYEKFDDTHAEAMDYLERSGFSDNRTIFGRHFEKDLEVTNGQRTFKPKLSIDADIIKNSSWKDVRSNVEFITKNIAKLDAQFRKDASKEFFSSNDRNDWPVIYRDGEKLSSLSKQEAIKDFEKHLGTIDYASTGVRQDGGYISYMVGTGGNFSVWYDGGGSFTDHVIDAEYSPKKKKFIYFGVQG